MRKENQKLGFVEKSAFAIANLGNVPVMMLVSSFLLIFYTNVVGLNPAACATLFLITRIVDAVNDPFVGFLLDRFPTTKFGKFRVTLIIGSILCALNYLLLWFGPLWAPTFKLGIAYISYLLLGVLFPVMDISLNSLLPVMTVDMKERVSLSTIKGAFYMIGGISVGIIAPIVIGNASESEGYVKLITCAVVVILVFSLTGALGVKERVKASKEQGYKVKDLLKILTLKPVVVIFIGTIINTIGTSVSGAVNAYFFTYVLGDLQVMSLISIVSIFLMFPGLAVSAILAKKSGKKRTYIIGLAFTMLAPLLRLTNVTNIPVLMLSTALAAFGSGVMMSQLYGIQADNTDYVEIATGQRAEGAVASLSSFTSKFAMGIGGSIPGYFLAIVGFDAAAKVQSAAVNQVLVAFSTYIPAIFTLLAILVIGFKYPLTKDKLDEQMVEMERRHEYAKTK